ncbi:MAG: 50S ribosomal protein L18 [Candidatus Parcubacteria bacterium]|nr:50S ribosomal protein L18 [Candidatus Parcubacteria bacterium]
MKAIKTQKRDRRHARVRAKVLGTVERPRLSIFRSNKFIYAQIIDDEAGKTLVSASDMELKGKKKGKIESSKTIGVELAKKAKEKNISKVVFDRGGYLYAGRVKAVAEGAREGGLDF